ncbi:SRPBCC family protein [Jannaschia sp. W003]|uniref:SRPBCC family protein n=1 Tax=Jannaschia sp. W003 TaxID=2867012 RepID=UPI0021A5F7B3|nr:SRPBCC family protein [Jannaschia sp. W003]UWQ22803.1 SRPBCC family protein [Jannaschia sp. W003]
MKFVATEDIRAPLDLVWDEVSAIERWEGLIRRGADRLERQPPGPPGPGTRWMGRGTVSGKRRDVAATLVALDPRRQLVIEGGTDGMTVVLEVALEARGPALTRLTVVTEARARTLSARLLLQSARLARASLAKRYKERVSNFASRMETLAAAA